MLPQCMQCQLPAFTAVCSDGISSARQCDSSEEAQALRRTC